MNSVPLSQHALHSTNDWKSVADVMAASASKVAAAGAEFAICPDNTYHQCFEYLIPQSPIPGCIARVWWRKKQTDLIYARGILGTKYLMEGPVYPSVLENSKFQGDT